MSNQDAWQPRYQAPARNGLATAGFVVALVGLVFSAIPIVGIVAWVIAPIGLVLSVVGLVTANRKHAGKGLAIAGIALAVLALIICIAYTVSFANAVNDTTPPALPTYASVAPGAPTSAAVPQPPGTVGAGTYLVGDDVEPGTYRTSGPTDGLPCYWSRLRDTTGDLGSIVANGLAQGPTTVTVRASDEAVEFSGDCTWVKR